MGSLTNTNQFTAMATFSLIATLAVAQLLDLHLASAMIATHVVLGSLAFIVGGIALISKKGSAIHKLTGRLFFLAMTFSAIYTLIVSLMPYHISPSMLQISVMTLYFLVGGMRSVSFKRPGHRPRIDRVMAFTVALVSLVIMLYPLFSYGELHPLRTVFGSVAIAFCVVDLWAFNGAHRMKQNWLVLHLSKMIAGYTTAVTGFFVAQNVLGGYFDWFTPTALSLIYITFWIAKLKISRVTRVLPT